MGQRLTAIGTLVERHSRYLMLFPLPNGHTAEAVRTALGDTIRRLPDQLWRSLTWDQGKEMAEHATFTIDTGVQIYFCDPKSPWQRGSNENTNGLLRQYLPKKTDMTVLTHTQLMPSPTPSTPGLDKPSNGRHHYEYSPGRCNDPLRPHRFQSASALARVPGPGAGFGAIGQVGSQRRPLGAWSGSPTSSYSPRVIEPASGISRPMTCFTRVVLPAPFGPRSP